MDYKERRNFVGYEYKEVSASGDKVSLLLDGYESFGWEVDDNFTLNVTQCPAHVSSHVPMSKTLLRLKRDRKILNKMELTRLQRNFEACVKEIETLENAKTTRATIWAIVVGIIGTAFMAGSVFAVVAPTPQILLCIVLAIPAFIGWILPYFIYKKLVQKDTEKYTMLIEAKYDEIYELCEKGNKLLF